MHEKSLARWQHEHVFLGAQHRRHERRTLAVVALTATMMLVEVAAGTIFGSLALLADGWHMATHAGALAIAAGAYWYARRHQADDRFAFGTGKVGDLAGFASAMVLGLVALGIVWESVDRLFAPQPIRFAEALGVAVVGLAVNIASAILLSGGHDHDHHGDHHHHHDTNLRAAYLHVVADALTSVLAIVGLALGWTLGWVWMDPVMGVVGALVIAHWSMGLIRTASANLLDMVPDRRVTAAIRERIEQGGDRVADLHLWRVGPGHAAAILSVVSHHPEAPDLYKRRLEGVPGLAHVTVEVQRCH
jgi:cation diffusion facilitator family transporter